MLDCFCGSGTTPVVAEKLNRRWVACDLGTYAIHTTRKRLVSIDNVKSFEIQATQLEENTNLSIALESKGLDVIVQLTGFETDTGNVEHWSQGMDYWAIDWNYQGRVSRSTERIYRTKKDRNLNLQATHTYEHPRTYTIKVMAVDLLGCEAFKEQKWK